MRFNKNLLAAGVDFSPVIAPILEVIPDTQEPCRTPPTFSISIPSRFSSRRTGNRNSI